MLRPITELDGYIIDEWISRDPYHSRQGLTQEFFRDPSGICFAIDDSHGPIIFAKLLPVDAEIVRLYAQFNTGEHRRTALALVSAFPIVRGLVEKAGMKYIVFDSESESLTRFCQKHLGFVPVPDSNDHLLTLT